MVFPRVMDRFNLSDPLLGGSIFNLSVRRLEGGWAFTSRFSQCVRRAPGEMPNASKP